MSEKSDDKNIASQEATKTEMFSIESLKQLQHQVTTVLDITKSSILSGYTKSNEYFNLAKTTLNIDNISNNIDDSLQNNLYKHLYGFSEKVNSEHPYLTSLSRNHSYYFIGGSALGTYYPLSFISFRTGMRGGIAASFLSLAAIELVNLKWKYPQQVHPTRSIVDSISFGKK